jgi:hypothetical protein
MNYKTKKGGAEAWHVVNMVACGRIIHMEAAFTYHTKIIPNTRNSYINMTSYFLSQKT